MRPILTVVAVTVGLVFAVRWLRSARERARVATERAMEGWAVEELATLVERKAPCSRQELLDTLLGRRVLPQVVQWLRERGVEAELTYTREGKAIHVLLVARCDQGQRQARRVLDWAEAPEDVRDGILSGSDQVIRRWQPTWA